MLSLARVRFINRSWSSLSDYLKRNRKYLSISVPCSAFHIPKRPGSEYHLGMLGYNRRLRGFHRALEVWEMLAKTDDRYKLFIRGNRRKISAGFGEIPQEQAISLIYLNEFSISVSDRIIFEPFGADVAASSARLDIFCPYAI